MKLRHTIIIRLVVISIIVLAIFWLSTSILIDKGIDMGRTNQFVDTAMTGSVIISSDLDHFSEITRDRALRPETQEFLKIGNASLQADYLRTLDEPILTNMGIDTILFFNKNGDLIYSRQNSKLSNSDRKAVEGFYQKIENSSLVNSQTQSEDQNGFLLSDDQVFMYAETGIRDNISGNLIGKIVIGRQITDEYISRTFQFLRTPVSVSSLDFDNNSMQKTTVIGRLNNGNPVFITLIQGNEYLVYTMLPALGNDKVFFSYDNEDRSPPMDIIGKSIVMMGMAFMFLLFIAVVIITLERSLFNRMELLSHTLEEMKTPDDIDPDSLLIKGDDELTELSMVLSNLVRRVLDINNNLAAAKKEAESANRAKSVFLANMSHEIRTPLNAIIGFSSLMDSDSTEPKLRRYVQSINSAGKTLLSLINDILDLSKIEAKKLELSEQPTDPKRLFEEVDLVLGQRAREKGLEFQLSLPDEVPFIVLDEVRVRQVIFNLVGNAIKFTDKGFVSLNLNFEQQDDTLCSLMITVEDSGIGIPEEDQKRIFVAFEQQDRDLVKHYGGTGLGLAISKNLVNIMGGSIGLESELGRGSKFSVYLPQKLISKERIEYIDLSPVDKGENQFIPAKILVVDDVENNRTVFFDILSQIGLSSVLASSVDEALRILENEKPDLILTDLRMPGLSGDELLKEVKRSEKLKKIPVIAVTALSSPEDMADMNLFDAVLRKPVIMSELLMVLRKYLPVRTGLPQDMTKNSYTSTQGEKTEESSETLTEEQANRARVLFSARINRISRIFSKESADELAQDMEKFGQEENLQIFLNIALDIREASEEYDIKHMKEVLKRVGDLINK